MKNGWKIAVGLGIAVGGIALAYTFFGRKNYYGGEIIVQRKYAALTTNLLKVIQKYSIKHGIPLQLTLATIDIESGFHDKAYNPECCDGTGEHGYRLNSIPYVLCENNCYKRYEIVQRKKRWETSYDRDNPEMWGSFGLMQMLPDTAWGYGFSPQQPNTKLFDVETNLEFGLRKLSAAWKNHGNIADVRSVYTFGSKYENWLASNSEKAEKVIDKFIDRIEMYEDMFGLQPIRRYP